MYVREKISTRSNNSRAYHSCRNHFKCRNTEKTGIIFQAKDTRNKITNETEYDNAQLAGLQGELASNQLYSGIGIIPGTDNGGWSEGGEGGNNSGGTNGTGGENQGGDTSSIEAPTITLTGDKGPGENVYASDVMAQFYTMMDGELKIKYLVSSSSEEIMNQWYPDGVQRYRDVANGGTLYFDRDGSYTITAYAYNDAGKMSNRTTISFKRDAESKDIVENDVLKIEVAKGTMGHKTYYRDEVQIRIIAKRTSKVTYSINGVATTAGSVASKTATVGEIVEIPETEIASEQLFSITANGRWTIQGYGYDAEGNKDESKTEKLEITVDTENPEANPVLVSGDEGETGYYRSDLTIRMQGGSDKNNTSPLERNMTYRVVGMARGDGTVAGQEVKTGNVLDTGEISVNTTASMKITADGVWTITTYVTDYAGRKSEGKEVNFTRDTVAPKITKLTSTEVTANSITVEVTASDDNSGIETYSFYKNGSFLAKSKEATIKIEGLEKSTEYAISINCEDKAR